MEEFFTEIADIYDETRGLPKRTMDMAVKALTAELGDCEKVLEIGVGTGRFARPLQENGVDMVGVDLSRTMLSKACGKNCRNLVMGDVCRLPFKHNSFDAVISIHVLHLVSDCEKTISEIKRVGKGQLLSVLHTGSDFHVLDEYSAALAVNDYTMETPGVGEWGLKELSPPRKTIAIAPYRDVITIGNRLRLLEQRKHSFAWNTPSGPHGAAMEFLREKYRDRLDDCARISVEVAVWDIEDLPDLIPGR